MAFRKISTLNALVGLSLLGLASAAFATGSPAQHELDPCINGQVSASGLYPTQEIEDAVVAAGEDALDPCLDGRVSSHGLYPTEADRLQALGD